MLAKLAICEEEADECIYWLELIGQKVAKKPEEIGRLSAEADELVAILVASIKTLRKRK